MSILQANEITIRIIDKTIIHGLSLSVPEGKVTSIIGPNGCGKSTTLKALARIWTCYKGMRRRRTHPVPPHLPHIRKVPPR